VVSNNRGVYLERNSKKEGITDCWLIQTFRFSQENLFFAAKKTRLERKKIGRINHPIFLITRMSVC